MKDIHIQLVDLISDDIFTIALSIGEDDVRMTELEMCKAATVTIIKG